MPDRLYELIEKQRQEKNYIIQTEKNDGKWAVIYASSSDIFFPVNEEGFLKDIVQKDKYEWFKTRIPYASKHIFIRDVARKFYRYGINNELSDLKKLADRLKPELEGYKVITVGSSAGGTAAIVLGNLLNAEFIFAFSPVIRSYDENYPKEKIENDLKENKIIDILPVIQNSDIPIYYMYPSKSDFDKYTVNLVKECQNIKFVPIECEIHGIPVNKRILKTIIKSEPQELEKIYKYKFDDSVNEFSFARDNWGLKMYLLRLSDFIKKYPLFIFKKEFYNIVIKSLFKKDNK